MSSSRAASSQRPRRSSDLGEGRRDRPGHAFWRFAAVYGVFVLAFAALRPAFLSREPNAFPVLGTTIYFSVTEVMEAAYFSTSFLAFIAIVLLLTHAGVLGSRPTALPEPPPPGAADRGDRLLIALGVLLPCILLLFPQGPPTLVDDALHHGERLVFQGRPFTEAYRAFFPFKPLIFMNLAGLLGYDNSIATYVAVHQFVQTVGYIAICLLVFLVVRLVRGRYSLVPVILFLLAYPLLADGLRYRYWILNMERLLCFLLFLNAVVLSLIHGRHWPLFFASAFAAVLYLASIEYAVFATCALAAHLALLLLRDRREGLRAAAAMAAGALPVVIALQASGQLLPLLRFISYASKFPSLYGTPLIYAIEDPALGVTPPPLPQILVAIWLALLWAAGVFVPRALLRRQLDNRSLWIYMALLLSVLMFKICLGRSDRQHLYIPILFSMLFLLTLALARVKRLPRVPRAVTASCLALVVTFAGLTGFRAPEMPAGFVYDGSPRIRAHIPPRLGSELAALRTLMAETHARSIFFFSDQPLYNYLLDVRYELRNPTLHEILTDDMLASETESFLAWSPDLVVWKAGFWTDNIDRIRTPARDYRLAAAILERYRPLVSRGGWLIMARNGMAIDLEALFAKGFTPIDASALEETLYWGDMAYNIGRSDALPDDFQRFTLTLPSEACCTFRQSGRTLIEFRGKAGTHRYGLYPGMAPGYRATAWDPDSISCTECDEEFRAIRP